MISFRIIIENNYVIEFIDKSTVLKNLLKK
jgi:hypothetical protein